MVMIHKTEEISCIWLEIAEKSAENDVSRFMRLAFGPQVVQFDNCNMSSSNIFKIYVEKLYTKRM